MKTTKAIRSTITVGDNNLDCYQMPDGSRKLSGKGLESLGISLGNSTGKKYARPLVLADNPQGKLTKIEGNNASAKLISLDTHIRCVGLANCQPLI